MATAKLSKYRAKRNFTKTVEPSGHSRIGCSNRLRFVIQKDAANRRYIRELASYVKSFDG
jgi:bifunctional non-homologous end joining protein LigD